MTNTRSVLPNSMPNPSIPLHCNVCPKKPNFSDVSHLLTHVSSKGHLAHYYKLKVKSTTDAASKTLLDQHDEWYDVWRIEDLMMERMDQKERKKSVANANGSNGSDSRRGSGANSAASSANTPVVAGLAGRRSLAQRESTLDPQLGPVIKAEPKSRSCTPASSFALDAATLNRSYAPPMQSGPATPYARSPMAQETSFQGSICSTLTSDSEELESLKETRSHSKPPSTNGAHSSFVGENEGEPDDASNGNTKLKGVLWDGMGMFDSATPDMRRKRNQKKATSVIHHLQATSDLVEATELVFDTEGDLRRERPITGNPEEDDGLSPLKGESSPEPNFPPPKKRATRRPRQALAEKNVNTGRVTRRRRGDSHHPALNNGNRRTPYFDGQDDDDDLTYGRSRPKSHTSLSIHRDSTGPEITFEHPAPLNTLTQGFRNPFHAAAASSNFQPTLHSGMFGRGHQRQPSFPYGSGFRPPNTNPLGVPPPNFGSFGQLNGHTMFQNHNPFTFPTGQQAFAAFQQPLTVGPQPFGNDNGAFHTQGRGQNHVQHHSQWDFFGLGQPNLGMQDGADISCHTAGDFTSLNPLLFSGDQPGVEDDEATVSPPGSER